MNKLFVALIEDSPVERKVAGLDDPAILERSVALGDIFGYNANFYTFTVTDHDNADRLAKEIAGYKEEGLSQVTVTDMKYTVYDFINHCLKKE